MTRLPGKDAPLEDSIARMSEGLVALGLDIQETRWINPVPHVWSVELQDLNYPFVAAFGKGSTPEAAKASALGGLYERLSTNYFFADYYLGETIANAKFVHHPSERWFPATSTGWPEGVLDDYSKDHFDPQDEICGDQLIDLNSSNEERGICCLPFIRQEDQQQVWFPVNIIGNLYVNNGMAAGNTRFEARVQALSEIFERHIKSTIISTGISLPRIPPAVIARYSRVEEAIKTLRVKGFYIDVRDASLGGKFPLVSISLFNRQDGGCLASFGAHPKFEVALERALLKLLHGRQLDQFSNLPPPTFDLKQAADPANLEHHFVNSTGVVPWDLYSDNADYPFTEWNIEGDSAAEFEELCNRIHRVDMQIYIADYQHLGMPVCRVLVPGMSELYPVDELVWRNNNTASVLRGPMFNEDDLDTEEAADLLDELEHLGINDQSNLARVLGILADANSRWGHMSVLEAKLLLALKAQNFDLSLGYCTALLDSENFGVTKRREYSCLHKLLSVKVDKQRENEAYDRVLAGLYGEPDLNAAKSLIAGVNLFQDLTVIDGSLSRFEEHQAMLSLYRRLQTQHDSNVPADR